jgi:hypothetical protein
MRYTDVVLKRITITVSEEAARWARRNVDTNVLLCSAVQRAWIRARRTRTKERPDESGRGRQECLRYGYCSCTSSKYV